MKIKSGAKYVLVGALGAAAVFHLAARGVWPERLGPGHGQHSGQLIVEHKALTNTQWRDLARRGRDVVVLANLVLLTASPGNLLTWNVDATFNPGTNLVECIGGGASGAAVVDTTNVRATGGGAGGYSSQPNIALTPGGTAQYQIGTGGAAVATSGTGTVGNPGNPTWFNGANQAASSVAANGGNGGQFGTTAATVTGGLGASIAGAIGTVKRAGGSGGSIISTGTGATGGGGSAGSHGIGGSGISTNSVGAATNGGTGDNNTVAAGTGSTTPGSATAGGSGTEWDATHGSGAGGGGNTGVAAAGGAGGNYGGGGGGAYNNTATTVTSGAGIQGIIAISWSATPSPNPALLASIIMIDGLPPPPDPQFGPNLGSVQGVRLVPPISGPLPQRPPVAGPIGGIRTAINVSWLPPQPYTGAYAWRFPYGSIPSPPPIAGPAPVPDAIWVQWIPPPPDPLLGPNLNRLQPNRLVPPISGPPPQNPPFRGPATGLPIPIEVAWLPPPPYTGPYAWTLTPPSALLSGNSGALFTLFNSIVAGQNLTWCDFDLYTITLFNGSVLRFTTADFDINVGGTIWTSKGVRVDQGASKAQAHWKLGFDVDTWTVVIMPRPTDIVTGAAFPDQIGNVPWIQAAHSGYLDAADFQVDRAFFATLPTWPMPPNGVTPTATKTIFAGKIAAIDCTDLVVVLTVNDYRDLLSINMPLHFFSGQCRHTLFDAGCNADGNMTIGRFSQVGTVKTGSTRWAIMPIGSLPSPGGSGTYTLGTVTMLSGNNNTFSRTVSGWDGTTLKLVAPFPFDVNPGDVFSASAGCDLQRTTCTSFGNLVNFGGQPYIPAPETTT